VGFWDLIPLLGNGVGQQELGNSTIIRVASRMEQVDVPTKAYN
jgi:hypothetical protein